MGVYGLFCQGFRVEGEEALLHVFVYPPGEPARVVDCSPSGRIRERPAALAGRFPVRDPFLPSGSVRLLLDGRDLTASARITTEGFDAKLPGDLAANEDHEAAVEWEGFSRRWSFHVDDVPPSLEVLSPARGAEVSGTVEIMVRASDDGPAPAVSARVQGATEVRFGPAEGEEGVFVLSIDASPWPPGERFLWIAARDAAGNETERVLPLLRR